MAALILVNIDSGNGLLPVWRQAITLISIDLLLIGLLRANFSKIWPQMQYFSF